MQQLRFVWLCSIPRLHAAHARHGRGLLTGHQHTTCLCRRPGPQPGRSPYPAAPHPRAPGPTITQTLSDDAQRNTIAFDGLAFLTGSLGADSFFPPGKVADFWGFQYLRDNDPSQMGHNPLFLTSAAFNLWNILDPDQRAQLKTLATAQVSLDRRIRRPPLCPDEGLPPPARRRRAHRQPRARLAAVKAYSANLYQLDGQMSYDRARVMGAIIRSFSVSQTTFLNTNMVGKGMLRWPAVTGPSDMQGLDRTGQRGAHDLRRRYLQLVRRFRRGRRLLLPRTPGYLLRLLLPQGHPSHEHRRHDRLQPHRQRRHHLPAHPLADPAVARHRPRRHPATRPRTPSSDSAAPSATQLRRFIAGESVSSSLVLSQSAAYGALDGEIIYHYATNLARARRIPSPTARRTQLLALRKAILGDFDLIARTLRLPLFRPHRHARPSPIRIFLPSIPNSDFLLVPSMEKP